MNHMPSTSPSYNITKKPARADLPVEPHKIMRQPVHPGVFFGRNILPEFIGQGHSGSEIARLLGISRQRLHRLMNGSCAVNAEMAVRLGKLCGNGPQLWLNMQAHHDIWRANNQLREELEKIPMLRD
jgi:antitoxin HigA-1